MPSEIAPDPTADSPNRSHIVIDTPDDNGNEVFARVRKVNKTIDITDLSDPQDAWKEEAYFELWKEGLRHTWSLASI